MTGYEQMKKALEENKGGRERKKRGRFIAWLIDKKYRTELPLDLLEDMLRDGENMSREWRKVLEDEPSLRGGDYNTKRLVEERKQIELGYIPGFEESIKLFNKL